MNIKVQACALLLLCYLSLTLIGCSDDSNNKIPIITVDPVIGAASNDDTPLVQTLTISTDINTRVAVELTAPDHKLNIEFKSFGQNHILPLYGLRAGRTYSAHVKVHGRNSESTVASKNIPVTIDPLPGGFPKITVTSNANKMEPGYTLFSVQAQGTTNVAFGGLLVIVDSVGEVVWYHQATRFLDVRQLPNGNIFAEKNKSVVELDLQGNHVHEWTPAGPNNFVGPDVTVQTAILHHEVFPMINGNFMALSIEARNYDNYPTSYDGSTAVATSLVAGDVIIEYQPDGTIVNQWYLLDMLDPYRIGYDSLGSYWDFYYGAETESRDWSHANAVVHDMIDDSVILSLRHQDALVKFKRQTGELVWILGPHENWDPATYGQYLLMPTSGQQHFWPYHPHAPMVMPNGDILVYDNGNWRVSPPDSRLEDNQNFSRAAQYAINEDTMEVQLVWEYGMTSQEAIFSGFLGDADNLPQTDNVLITHGSLVGAGNKFSAHVVEVTRDDPPREVFNMTVSDAGTDVDSGWRVYRSERIRNLFNDDIATISVLK